MLCVDCSIVALIMLTNYEQALPVWHCVPLKPGAQLQLNPFTRSVQVPLFLQGWLAQSSISNFSEDKMKRTKLKYSMIYLSVRNKNSNSEIFLCALLTLSHHHKNYNFIDCDWFKKLIFTLPRCYRTVSDWTVCYWTVCSRTVQQANHI